MSPRWLQFLTFSLLASLNHGFTVSPNSNKLSGTSVIPAKQDNRIRKNSITMYVPSSTPTTQTPPLVAQQMLKTVGTDQERSSKLKLSSSVLASCDTLPSFKTAHGLLSPETVLRMDEMTGSNSNEAVANFLDTYRRYGPMSCLSMLSDPDVLPHLTAAMRDIA